MTGGAAVQKIIWLLFISFLSFVLQTTRWCIYRTTQTKIQCVLFRWGMAADGNKIKAHYDLSEDFFFSSLAIFTLSLSNFEELYLTNLSQSML